KSSADNQNQHSFPTRRSSDLESLASYYPSDMTFERFSEDRAGKTIGKMESYKVSPTIADNIKRDSLWAVLGAMAAMFLYILLRLDRKSTRLNSSHVKISYAVF